MELRERKEWKEENHKDRVKVEKKNHLPGVCVCMSVCVCVSVRASRSALEQRLTSAAVDRQMFLGPSPAHPPGATHPPTPTPSAFHLPSPALQGPPPFFVDFFPIYGNRVRGQKKKLHISAESMEMDCKKKKRSQNGR